ncbi:MAG: hypothetical protein JO005_11655 [Gammaproteobacteria bacterium]|nr:hypothetical protein [Gammaproteobacteria bacterium]
MLALAALALSSMVASVGLAETPTESHACELLSPVEAEAIADALYKEADYQGAAECYDAAGDAPRAHRAYARAVLPKSEVAGGALREQGDAAKALLSQLERAFHGGH